MPEYILLSDIVRACFVTSMAFVFIPCVITLNKHCHEIYFRKRGLVLVKSYLYISGLNQIIFLPTRAILYIWDNNLGSLFYIFYFCALFGSTISMSILIARVLLQWVNIRRSEDSCNWKHQIDPNYKNISWVLRYYHIIGNPTQLLFILLSLVLLEAILIIYFVITVGLPYNKVAFKMVQSFANSVLFVTWILRFIVLFLCFHKLKRFIDYYYIRDELKYMTIVLILCMTIGLIGVFIGKFILIDHEWSELSSTPIYTNSIWQASSWYLSTIWVKKINTSRSQKTIANSSGQEKTKTSTKTQQASLLEFIQTEQGIHLSLLSLLFARLCLFVLVCDGLSALTYVCACQSGLFV